MDQAKSGLIRKVLIKDRGAEIFREIFPAFILWEPFEVFERLLVLWSAIWKPIEMAVMGTIAPLSMAEQGPYF